MAGLGFKDFAVGEVLTSADVDGYLMQQTVMRFADAGARGSALGTATGTAVALAEGMVTYLDDADDVQFYTGAAWKSVIGVKQVIQTVKTDTFTTTSGAFTDVTGLTATITPSSTASKVLIVAQVVVGDLNTGAVFLRLNGGNADDYVGDAASNRTRAAWGGQVVTGTAATISHSLVYLDSPATTSATTYAVQGRIADGSTLYVNRTSNDSDLSSRVRAASSITVMEVAA